MKSLNLASLALGALASAAITSAYASSGKELLLSAPIEKLDRSADTVTVLGQDFHTKTDQLSLGEIVNVYGELKQDGSVDDTVVQGTNNFSSNGDPIFLKGVVTDADSALGRVEIDGMTVDYTAELANPDFAAPLVGDVVAVAAAQPAVKGVIVANATGSQAYAAGMASHVAALNGGGASSAALNGGGASAAALNGGGASSAALNGGGASAAALNGGGASSAALNGGGASSAALNGGGASSAALNGGGASSAALNGGGASSAALNGGGASAAALNGGGASAAALNGGGASAAALNGGGARAY